MRRIDAPPRSRSPSATCRIDVAGHSVTRDGEPINLTPLEFDLLVCLARKPWQVFTREVLLEQVWGYRHAADTRLVNVHVQRLRSKVEHDPENPEIVVTVRGVGYKAGTVVGAGRAPRPRAAPSRPAPLRRALTFWRRSIQARVVASTVLLSALVIAAVGWLLLQQTRDGLLDHAGRRRDRRGRPTRCDDANEPARRRHSGQDADAVGATPRPRPT